MFPACSLGLAICSWFLFTRVRAYAVDEPDTASSEDSNVTYVAPHVEHLPSIFSPRMDFEQWKPLTGRGDPLRNDPTYDYDPPKLDRVHYWIDPASRQPDEKIKSEVLVLGVSSKKPSVVQPNVKRDSIDGIHKFTNPKVPNYMHYQFSLPNMPSRHRPTSHVAFPSASKTKYEDYNYKINDHLIPMTILVPPPPPHPGQIQSNLFATEDEEPVTRPTSTLHETESTSPQATIQEQIISTEPSLSIQESNLIYQSSTVSQDWDYSINVSNSFAEESVDSDYAGWGPTIPPEEEESRNDTHNLINSDHFEIHHPYSFYRPMFSEVPPPPQSAMTQPLYVLTPRATTERPVQISSKSVTSVKPTTFPDASNAVFQPTETPLTADDENITTEKFAIIAPTPLPLENKKTDGSLFAMLGPMMAMPMTDGPQRPEDNLYAQGTDNLHIFKEPTRIEVDWEKELESMQTMQPPPVTITTERMTVHFNQHKNIRPPNTGFLHSLLHKETSPLDLISSKMKYPIFKPVAQTPSPITTTIDPFLGNVKTPTEINLAPMYLIIQGHSKVKTYGLKNKGIMETKEAIDNEIPQVNERQQVKHLHPLKDEHGLTKSDINTNEVDRSKNGRSLKKLVSEGVGTIDIQEANLGIQYDVSDGSEVPIEIYRKGFVDTEENDYDKLRKNQTEITVRKKRQLDLEDIMPVDEETIEEYVYNYLKKKSNEKSITGLIAAAITSDAANAVDELEDGDEEDNDSAR